MVASTPSTRRSSRSRSARTLLTGTATLALVVSDALLGSTPSATAAPAAPSAPAAARTAAAPSYTVGTVVSGLRLPWDLTWAGSMMMYDLRGGGLYGKRGSAKPKRITLAKGPRLFVGSEAGMLGLVADPKFSSTRWFYSCQAVADSRGRPLDVRVLRWKLDSDTHATLSKTMIKGLPISSGRHSGCRLRFSKYDMLYVGTGDAAEGRNPQNLQSLGGKILRIRRDGSIPPSNPFYSRGGNARYVWNYGHRNVQGLALRPGTNDLWSVEQGTYRDDEVNRVVQGGNYGYNPLPGTYNESVPMTDTRKYPKAIRAAWRSGDPTIATCGATFLSGSRWKSWNGALVVGVLKDEQIRIMKINSSGSASTVKIITALKGRHRIRTVQLGPDGALYFTTSDGSNDVIGKITPR
ncbi:glucose/arabinose dehydrogenase [Friedmanniella endophytica]|uniref:Glucose/arabinose dehydrogenase n=1 Tax=Microlunatus kandeliicorticis TaxID=1759536 RepID=A0A7W3P4Y7_9ACTN|nr:PQQ-dependent sugar dehydrogenase [Microlunatus kandeliicorticis]MBA8793408.1 glucose/arabinose dehydrogenase [Microlunatus kandeliicorticis]